MVERVSDDERRCRRCGVLHCNHPDASADGGLGRLLAWSADVCPACVDKRREWRRWGALHIAGARLDPNDEYFEPVAFEQAAFEEVLW